MSSQRVLTFVREFQDLARTAGNETELRGNFVTAAISRLGIRDLKMERERQDVRRNRVIIEFKDKGLFHGRADSAKFEEARKQLTEKYIPEQARIDGRPQSDYIGVCFDGLHLAFVYIEEGAHVRVSELRPLDEHSAAVLIAALDQDDRIALTPENVGDDFGPGSAIAEAVLGALWEHLNTSLEAGINRVEMLFTEWNDLFEQSTSLGTIGQARLGAYLQTIGLPADADPTRVLFVLHSYHALFFKLLAAEVVLANTLLPGIPEEYCFGAAGLADGELIASLERDIEESGLFRQAHLLNFVEGSFFAWYLVGASLRLATAIRLLLQRLSLYRLSGLQLARTRDIVKRVYQQLVPAALRKNIGEYFTPEWLVEFTLARAGYQGPQVLERKLLDPCCGSGNFLIHAINCYKAEARAAGWEPEETLRGIIDHIAGFDLNPLAVLTARVNYLIAVSDLVAVHPDIEIPVYQADAVHAPTVSESDRSVGVTRTYEVGTRKQAIDLELPEALIQRNRLFGRVLEIMERTIRDGDPEAIFLATLRTEPTYVAEPGEDRAAWEPMLLDLFRKVEQLERDDWNRIWCRIVRNYFASVAVGRCQYVAGNPPWVRWSELPSRYTERIKPTCDDYGVFSEDRFFGGNELDISGMITYAVADKWLDPQGGRLAFVITQTHFQSQSSGGFRQFKVKGTPLRVLQVDDLVKVRPFAGLGNKPAVLSLVKGEPTSYPIPYREWERTTLYAIPEDADWQIAKTQLRFKELEANPLSGPGQRWSLLPPGRFQILRALDGADPSIAGRKGIVTDLNGVYFVELLGPGRRPGTIKLRNAPEEGRQKVPRVTEDVEADLVYPLIKGAENIRAFRATTSPLYVAVPNRGITQTAIPTPSQLAGQGKTGALRYFRRVNEGGVLDRRSTWRTRMYPVYERRVRQGLMIAEDTPIYAIYDVGDYTFAPYKVVWAEMAGTLQAAVIDGAEVPHGGGHKPVVPDHKVYFAAFDDPDYAHYACALLNSAPVREFVDSFTIKIQVGTLFRHIRLPAYDPEKEEHAELVRHSREAHRRLTEAGGADIADSQSMIDRLANRLLASILES